MHKLRDHVFTDRKASQSPWRTESVERDVAREMDRAPTQMAFGSSTKKCGFYDLGVRDLLEGVSMKVIGSDFPTGKITPSCSVQGRRKIS